LKRLHTIGYYSFGIDELAKALLRHGVNAVADVRSVPFSKYKPEFNQGQIEGGLQAHGIGYVFLGKELGVRSDDGTCYVPIKAGREERVDFCKLAESALFKSGMERLVRGMERYNVALLCAEKDPLMCHRALLVCRQVKVVAPGAEIWHVLADGKVEHHRDMERRMFQFLAIDEESLFDEASNVLDNAYDMMSERIAYVREKR